MRVGADSKTCENAPPAITTNEDSKELMVKTQGQDQVGLMVSDL
jgi:hypothetical protein